MFRTAALVKKKFLLIHGTADGKTLFVSLFGSNDRNEKRLLAFAQSMECVLDRGGSGFPSKETSG